MNAEPAEEVPVWVPWEGPQADYEAVAAGTVLSREVQHWLQQAQRVEYPHAGGAVVLHHWAATVPNGLAPVVLFHGGSGSWTHWVRSIGPLGTMSGRWTCPASAIRPRCPA